MWSGRPEWEGGSCLCLVHVVLVRSSDVLIVRLDGLLLPRFLGGTVHNDTIRPNTFLLLLVLLLLMWTLRRDCDDDDDDDDDLLVKLQIAYTITSLRRWNSAQNNNTQYIFC